MNINKNATCFVSITLVYMLSKYYYTVPNPIIHPLYVLVSIHPFYCPCFIPIAADYCRYCQKKQIHHQKYYIYSNYARKIQQTWFKKKFRLFSQQVQNKYHMLIHHESVLLQIFKNKYYRRWDVYHWEMFLKKFQGNAFKK